VVCNQDGHPSAWKPGNNCQVTIPIRHTPTTQAGEVAITDAWDGSIQEVQVRQRGLARLATCCCALHAVWVHARCIWARAAAAAAAAAPSTVNKAVQRSAIQNNMRLHH
jgi:hypothetical protein